MVSVQFHKNFKLKDRHFVVGGMKNFKLLPDISFDGGFQNIVEITAVIVCLLLS